MCGIVGYLGNGQANDYILSGLKLLQNRGYDSVGISYMEKNIIETIKYASTSNCDSLLQLERKITNDSMNIEGIAIGHTRWATHGAKTNFNAHPHNDNLNRISLVHNGIIENFAELKKTLILDGYEFRSQTDTEIIAVLIGKYLDAGETVEKAIQNTIDQLLGTWALVIIHKDFPNKIWVTRNGSPLLLGIEDDFIMVASEQIAFNNYIKKYIVLDNHDLIEITNGDSGIEYNKNIQRYTKKDKIHTPIELTPTNHTHWMLKEIMEQPESIIRALNNGGRIENNVSVKLGGLDLCKSRLMDINHLILLGCGTSYHSALWSLDTFKSLDIFDTIVCYDGAEFNVKDIPKKGKTGVILLSQSGETKDLHRCIQIAKDYDLISIGIVNVIDSLIARETDCGVYLNAGREVAVASTKSFTNQCVVLCMVAVWFSQNRGTCIEKRRKIINDLRNLSFQMQKILDKAGETQDVANVLINKPSMFILGKGKDEAIAKEGSLKLKEIAYIHAEGYSSSALKHGPFALIENELPIIILDISDEYRDKNRNAYQEVSARNAFVLKITDIIETENENSLIIEKNATFGGLLANIHIQLLSYYLALSQNYNPDFPRNLAKVVTVE
jgi:glucosamine--fructose-6-phosphate aminotransferase (isomerizing)